MAAVLCFVENMDPRESMVHTMCHKAATKGHRVIHQTIVVRPGADMQCNTGACVQDLPQNTHCFVTRALQEQNRTINPTTAHMGSRVKWQTASSVSLFLG